MVKHALFLGYGRMGSALGEAWLQAGLVQHIDAVDPGRIQGMQASLYPAGQALPATDYDLVVIAVKPALAQAALQAIPTARLARACFISVMAGVSLRTLETLAPAAAPIIRTMPNTPVIVGQGCTGLYANKHVSPALKTTVSALFAAVGTACWVETEDQLHAVTAISGSGPAYYHLFSEALAQAGVKLGLPPGIASMLAARTALGAATLQCREQADFAALRLAVTSPNGTAHAAIQVFEQDGQLRHLVDQAATHAHARSRELDPVA